MRAGTRWHNMPSSLVAMRLAPRLRPTRPPWRRARFRSWVVSCALLAIVWPSLGGLPWIALHAVAHEHSVAQGDGDHDAGPVSPEGHRHSDASDIPGSPLHPVDHDCFPCQVLAHLGRCALLAPKIPVVAVVPPRLLRPPPVVIAPRVTVLAAILPPVRAPPPRNA